MTHSTNPHQPLSGWATEWLQRLESALDESDAQRLAEVFLPVSYWRDVLAFTWDVRQYHSREALISELISQAERVNATGFAVDPTRTPPRTVSSGCREVVEFFFTFETSAGSADGMFFGEQTEGGPLLAFSFFTRLQVLAGGEPRSHIGRPAGLGFEPRWPGQTWAAFRRQQLEYDDRSPEVLVVGGGQAGAILATKLDQMNVDTLVVDKHERPGDSWRKRYDSLALHTYTDMSNMPDFPFPSNFPQYLPKDKYADYLESYVTLMDLNYWTSTTFLGAEFDEASMTWRARVDRAGEVRELFPKHVVMCIGGAGGSPHIPDLSGLVDFEGVVVHSSQFRSGAEHPGARSLVVGVGTSAHDIALDLSLHDGDVQMLQRGSTTVVDVEVANTVFADFVNPGIPQEEADMRSSARSIYPLLVERLRAYTKWTDEVSAELHAGLERAGMKLDTGEDGTGWQMKFVRYAGGYYLNVGASNAIIEGAIKIIDYNSLERFVPSGIKMADGSIRELDLVVLATGYEPLTADVRAYFGAEVADRVGPIAGVDVDGERRNFCRVTPQPQLWFTFGGISEGRRSVPVLALQIKANLLGIVPTLVRDAELRVRAFEGFGAKKDR